MPTFSTSFAPPAPPTGLTATAFPGSHVALEWDATALGVDFVAYNVYRSLTGVPGSYERIGRVTTEADAHLEDYEAALDVELYYQVMVESVLFESDPAEVTSELDVAQWWLVTPGAADQSYELRIVSGYEDETPVPSVEHVAMGRRRKLVESSEELGIEGTITLTLKPEDRGLLAILRGLSGGASEYMLLKTPFGEVYRVNLGSVRRRRLEAGLQSVTFPVVEVA